MQIFIPQKTYIRVSYTKDIRNKFMDKKSRKNESVYVTKKCLKILETNRIIE